MLDFSTVNGLKIGGDSVTKITSNGKVLWELAPSLQHINYVSLGDSIAVGHRIDKNWETDYGWGRQYRCSERLVRPTVEELKAYIEEWKANKENAKDLALGNMTLDETIREYKEDGQFKGYYCTYSWNTSTKIVPNSYTDRISKKLSENHTVTTTSFAVSGSMIYRKDGDVRSLIQILDDEPVRTALSKANLVTISIGANSILEAGLDRLPSFLTEDGELTGNELDDLEKTVEYNLRKLADTTFQYSYEALFDKLIGINDQAQYIFTTVHNPMKYLYVERGTWDNDFADGFLGEWLSSIPIVDDSRALKKLIVDLPYIVGIRERVNGNGSNWEGISAWAERYIEEGGISTQDGESYPALNDIIRQSITNYNNPHIVFTEIHELFDTIPDRDSESYLHYNDLVNMQITKGYQANDLDWSKLWGQAEGKDANEKIRNYWTKVLRDFAAGSIDKNSFMSEMEDVIVDRILSEAFDPHPRTDGHYVMYRAFADAFGWESLKTITYNSNNGENEIKSQKVLQQSIVDGKSKQIYSLLNANTFKAPDGYRFTGWDRNVDGIIEYANSQCVPIKENINLYAQWSNQCIIRYKHTKHTDWVDFLGAKPKNYQLWADGALIDKLTELGQENIFAVPYGTSLGVVVSGKSGGTFTSSNGYVTYNGEQVTLNSDNGYNLPNGVVSDLVIDFQWRTTGVEADTTPDVPKTSFYDCHIDNFDASRETLRHLYTLKYDVNVDNGGKQDGTIMPEQKLLRYNDVDIKTLYQHNVFNHQTGWYYLKYWKDQKENVYADEDNNYTSRQPVLINFNAILSAQWSDLYPLTIKQAYNIQKPDLDIYYGLRKMRAGHPNNWTDISIREDLGSRYKATKEQTVNVHYNDRIQIQVGGQVQSGSDKPDCRIRKYLYDDANGDPVYTNDKNGSIVKEDGSAEGYFVMPARNVEVELWFNNSYSIIIERQRWWDAYVNDSGVTLIPSPWT